MKHNKTTQFHLKQIEPKTGNTNNIIPRQFLKSIKRLRKKAEIFNRLTTFITTTDARYLWDRMKRSRRGCGSCCHWQRILCSRTADSLRWRCQNTSERSDDKKPRSPTPRNSRLACRFSSLLPPQKTNDFHTTRNSPLDSRNCFRCLDNRRKWTDDILSAYRHSDSGEIPQNKAPGLCRPNTCLKTGNKYVAINTSAANAASKRSTRVS